MLDFYIGHSSEKRDWTFSAEQSKQGNSIGSMYAAVISQRFHFASKTRLYRLTVPALCTVV
jgi:hypothetical protein